MIGHAERARREEAHVKADMAWSDAGIRSRAGGLGDLVRSISTMPSETPLEVLRLRQEHHKRQLRAAAVRALEWSSKRHPWNPRHLDRSRYFPHQSERERTRGERQAARRAA